MIHMSREKALKILNEPNGSEKLAAKAEQAFEPAWALYIKENNAAAGAFFWTLAMPLRQASSEEYTSEVAITSPFPAFRSNLMPVLVL